MNNLIKITLLFAALSLPCAMTAQPPVSHPKVGIGVEATNKALSIKLTDKKQNFNWSDNTTRDEDILSPKSVNIHPNGKKFYVNSLEGCRTVVFNMETNKKLAVIHHKFDDSHASLWAPPSGLYQFTHYSKNLNTFSGKPVESTFSHGGRYLWVPYYRRSYDINAQDPSAMAVIDTERDTIVRMFETGPLPKMVACSHDGRYIVVSHWGNNTVGLLNIEGSDPEKWHYEKCFTVDYVLPLNYSLSVPVNRDNGSGYMLRGTVFTPDDHYLLIGCMGGTGGIAVIDLQKKEYLGRLTGVSNARHLVIKNDYLYVSLNSAGIVQRLPLEKVIEAIGKMQNKTSPIGGWEQCHVGGGARTIELSPSGRFVFAACNSASKMYVVDTRDMKVIANIDVDSYPVGLDISRDGTKVIVTSQARPGAYSGNAVNIYTITYAEPERLSAEEQAALDRQAQAANQDGDNENANNQAATDDNTPIVPIAIAAGALALIIALVIILRRRKK